MSVHRSDSESRGRERQARLCCRLLLLALVVGAPIGSGGGAVGAREVHRSNAVGVIVSALPANTPLTEPGYLLVVDASTDTRTERLYSDGELIRQVDSVINGRTRTESIYRAGIIGERNSYDSSERLLSSISYDENGELQRSIRYTHRSNGIVAEHFNSDEELVFREQQNIDQNGRVVGIIRNYADESTEEVQFVFLNRRLLREVHQLGNLELTLKYDTDGRLIREEHRFDGQLQKEIDYTYGEQRNDRIPDTAFTTEQNDELTMRTEQTNNAQGQTVAQRSYENDILVEQASFTYQQAQLRSARIQRTGSTSQQELVYDQSGEQIEERWYENGALVRSVLSGGEGDGETIELRYVDGKPYVRIFFRNGTRLKEEFLTGDDITRERVLE